MTTESQQARQRLAEAVKALDAAYERVRPFHTSERGTNDYLMAVTARNNAQEEVFAAARALLDAPDDAAELRAVKALHRWGKGMHPPRVVSLDLETGEWLATQYAVGDQFQYFHLHGTATELCKKLGVPHE